ncbi:MAG: AAA family ATPase [Planctomycetota bacterium]|nr:AAA family ATPase [Planctomycetota bacterium]
MPKRQSTEEPIDLREILRRLNPNVPAGFDASALPRTARESTAIRQLRTSLAADPYAKALLTGHIGVGKSTELWQLRQDLTPDRFVVWTSIAQSLGVHNANTFSLLIVILEALIREWVLQLGELPPGLVEELVTHVRDQRPSRPARRTAVTAGPVGLPIGPSVWEELLERTIGAATGTQLADLYSDILQRLALRYISPGQLVTLDVSRVARSCEVVIKELEGKAQKPVLLVIDDLDKVRDETTQHELFIDHAMAWMRLPCGVLATLPLDGLFTQQGRELDHVWGEIGVLDPLPVPEPHKSDARDANLQPYLNILRSIGGQQAFSALQCRQLAYLSGGLPRAFVHACAACVGYALDAGDAHVLNQHIDLVQHAMTDRWRGRLTDDDYAAIVDVLDSGGANVPCAIQSVRDGLLLRDGSAPPDKQFRLAAWAEPLVEAYRKRMSSGKAVSS